MQFMKVMQVIQLIQVMQLCMSWLCMAGYAGHTCHSGHEANAVMHFMQVIHIYMTCTARLLQVNQDKVILDTQDIQVMKDLQIMQSGFLDTLICRLYRSCILCYSH